MYRCVVLSALWPASICTSRNEPPTVEIVRAAFVMNVRRPEWLEQPFNPAALKPLRRQFASHTACITAQSETRRLKFL
jgi:hypothetical protein